MFKISTRNMSYLFDWLFSGFLLAFVVSWAAFSLWASFEWEAFKEKLGGGVYRSYNGAISTYWLIYSLRWLFLVECVTASLYIRCRLFSQRGLITLSIGIVTFFKMPPSPTQTKAWFRPKGWFTEREEHIATTRILRDDPTKVLYCFSKHHTSYIQVA